MQAMNKTTNSLFAKSDETDTSLHSIPSVPSISSIHSTHTVAYASYTASSKPKMTQSVTTVRDDIARVQRRRSVKLRLAARLEKLRYMSDDLIPLAETELMVRRMGVYLNTHFACPYEPTSTRYWDCTRQTVEKSDLYQRNRYQRILGMLMDVDNDTCNDSTAITAERGHRRILHRITQARDTSTIIASTIITDTMDGIGYNSHVMDLHLLRSFIVHLFEGPSKGTTDDRSLYTQPYTVYTLLYALYICTPLYTLYTLYTPLYTLYSLYIALLKRYLLDHVDRRIDSIEPSTTPSVYSVYSVYRQVIDSLKGFYVSIGVLVVVILGLFAVMYVYARDIGSEAVDMWLYIVCWCVIGECLLPL